MVRHRSRFNSFNDVSASVRVVCAALSEARRSDRLVLKPSHEQVGLNTLARNGGAILRTRTATGGTLAGALASQGLAGAKLERRYGNHLFVPVSINNRRGALMIDTGSPNTLIDRNSVNTFGLTVEKTDSSVGGLFGRSWERFGASKVKSIAMGNCMVTNVPVAIADLSGMNPERERYRNRITHFRFQSDGTFKWCARSARDGQVWNDHRLHPADALH